MSKRDILLIKLLIVMALGGLIYYFGHLYMEEELRMMNAERTSIMSRNEELRQGFNELAIMNERLAVFETLIADIAERYTREFEQAEYILYLRGFLEESGIVLRSFTYTVPRALPVQMRQTSASDENNIAMGYNSYRLQFNATYEQLLTFLRITEESGRGFTSSNALISLADADEGILNVNMELRFFYLADMDEFTLDYDFSEILENALFLEERRSIFE